MHRSARAFVLLLAMGLAVAGNAVAQPVNREQEQVHRLRQQLQQLQQEGAAAASQALKLGAENTALQQRLKLLEANDGGNRARLAAASQQAATLSADLDTLKSAHSTLQSQLTEVKSAQALTSTQLADTRIDLARSQKALTERDGMLSQLGTQLQSLDTRYQQCTAQNQALADLGREVIDRYANRGLDEMFKLREPFVQVQRVTLENLILAYRERLDAQTLGNKSASR